MLANITYLCYTDDFNNYKNKMIIPLIILFVVVIPIALYHLLNKNKNKMLKFEFR